MLEDFGGDVGWCAAQGCSERLFANDLCKTKICELDVELLVDEEDVLGLDVAMYDAPLVLRSVST